MVKVIEKAGIYCIFLPEGVIMVKNWLTMKSMADGKTMSFTDIQRKKERETYKDLMRELKEKFRDETK